MAGRSTACTSAIRRCARSCSFQTRSPGTSRTSASGAACAGSSASCRCPQSSAGWTEGTNISWAPALFISSRTMLLTFCRQRRPSGRYVYVPLANLRIRAERIISRWLVISASAGTCLRVGINVRLYRIYHPLFFEAYPINIERFYSLKRPQLQEILGCPNIIHYRISNRTCGKSGNII